MQVQARLAYVDRDSLSSGDLKCWLLDNAIIQTSLQSIAQRLRIRIVKVEDGLLWIPSVRNLRLQSERI